MRKIDVQKNKVKTQLESGRQCEVNLPKRLILVLITRKGFLPAPCLFTFEMGLILPSSWLCPVSIPGLSVGCMLLYERAALSMMGLLALEESYELL